MKSCFCLSKRGDREINEDTVGIFENGAAACFIVADGLGGHGKGEMASQLAVEVCRKQFEEMGYDEGFFQAYFETCEAVLEQRQKDEHAYYDIKTTVVMGVAENNRLHCAHAGDSRLYCFRRRKIIHRTLDHSVPQMLVFSGEIREKEIRKHPDRNRLLKVMGQKAEEVYYERTGELALKDGDALLLCSDGFWELIEEKHMISTLKKAKSAQEWMAHMEEIVLKNGESREMDNYSAIAVIF